ncbi:MAG: internal scaffolding protein [Arizlama microvirus]|nr:MAG: internal scaffolding protein [Arizlama microvirus]
MTKFKDINIPFFRTAYNYDTDLASDQSSLSCPEPSLAQQQFAEECDINTIVRRFGITGELPSNVRAPTFGDFTGVDDYQSALNAIYGAQDAFMELPADVRYRFHNNPQEFVVFCSNDANRAEAEKLGLVLPQADSVIQPVNVDAQLST